MIASPAKKKKKRFGKYLMCNLNKQVNVTLTKKGKYEPELDRKSFEDVFAGTFMETGTCDDHPVPLNNRVKNN